MTKQLDLPIVRGQYKFDAKIINWFDLKGRAEILFRPADMEDLIHFLKNIDHKIPLQIIGAGSNVIVCDDGVKGVLIKLSTSFLDIKYENTGHSNSGSISIGGATPCQNVAKYCQEFGIGGLEFLSGIPGTIGGAIAMNAGCYGSDISENLISAQALDYQGNYYELSNKDFGFFYRGSEISKKYIFIKGVFNTTKSSIQEVSQKIKNLQEQREKSQPIRAKTGGSTFKNPDNKKAWELIDAAGFRGKTLGGAKFSEKHCNFLINIGNAKSSDLIKLGEEAKKEVRKKFGINLDWEIKELK